MMTARAGTMAELDVDPNAVEGPIEANGFIPLILGIPPKVPEPHELMSLYRVVYN